MSCIVLAVLTSCATSKSSAAMRTVVLSEILADELSAKWPAFVERKQLECSAQEFEDRDSCLGTAAQGEGFSATLDSLLLVKIAVRETVLCEEKILPCDGRTKWDVVHDDAVFVFERLRNLEDEMNDLSLSERD